MTKNRKMKTPRKRLVAQLDALFSFRIRIRDKRLYGGICPLCKSKPIECCFHFVTRAKHSLRWDERNAIGSCHGCNYRYEYDPHFAIEWYQNTYGKDSYYDLIRDGNKIAKFSNEDLNNIKLELSKQIAEVPVDKWQHFGRKA